MIATKGGDRRALTSMELKTLDEKVIPTARRWLRECPQLAHHAVSTLAHWGEPLIDDHGKAYRPANEATPKRMDAAE